MAISIHKGILKYLTKEVDISTEDEADKCGEKMKIYEENSKAWDFLIIILTDITCGLVRQCDKNAKDTWKSLIDNYEVTDEN